MSHVNEESPGGRQVGLSPSQGPGGRARAVLFPVARYTLARVPATVPTITRVQGASGNVSNGGSTYDSALTLTGEAEPGLEVEIFNRAGSKGIVRVDAAGKWTLTITGLGIATHLFRARGLYGSEPESEIWEVKVVKRPLTIEGFIDHWGAVYRNGSTASNNSPKYDGKNPPRGWLVCYVFGSGAAGPNRVRFWMQSKCGDGSTYLGHSQPVPVNPDGSFRSREAGAIPWNIPRHTLSFWMEDIQTGEQSQRLSCTFVPATNVATSGIAAAGEEGGADDQLGPMIDV